MDLTYYTSKHINNLVYLILIYANDMKDEESLICKLICSECGLNSSNDLITSIVYFALQ